MKKMKPWSREQSKERFPKAISPLGWSLLFTPMQATLEQMSKTLGSKEYQPMELMVWHDYYVYTQKDFFKNIRNIRLKPKRVVYLLFCLGKNILVQGLSSLWRQGPFLSRLGQVILMDLFGKSIEEMVIAWPRDVESLKAKMGRDFYLHDKKDVTHAEFLTVREQMQDDSRSFFAEDFNVYFFKHLLASLLLSQLKRQGLSHQIAQDLLSALSNGLEDNFSIRMVADFSNEAIPITELKRKYGHLTDNWDLLNPVLAEQDSVWSQRQWPQFQFAQNTQRSHSAATEIAKILSWNKKIVTLIKWYQDLILIDEDLRAYSSLQYPQARRLMSLVEQTDFWKSLGLEKDDVYFLFIEEIETGLKRKNFAQYVSKIKERKNAFHCALQETPPYEFFQNADGRIEKQAAQNKNLAYPTGDCVSSGRVQGKVTLVRSYDDLSRISKQSVIVLETATPVFAPFYAICGGIIAEVGGHLSHGAIVARECGIPMLTGVENACSILSEGQEVLLDADKRLVKVINYGV